MVHFIGYVLPCIIYAYLFFKSRKLYNLVFLIFFIINLITISIMNYLIGTVFGIIMLIQLIILIYGAVLACIDYIKEKK